jgi:hypothetical protein
MYSESHCVISTVRLEVMPVVVAPVWLVVVAPLPAAEVTPEEAGPRPIIRTPVKTVLLTLACALGVVDLEVAAAHRSGW